MQPVPPCPTPACHWWMQASVLLLCWWHYRWAHNLWVLIIYLFFPPGYVPPGFLCGSKACHRLGSESVFWWLKLFSFLRLPSQMELGPYLFCLSFCVLYVVLPPFEENGLLFWVPDILCRHWEVVLWNLLRVQMFFWWICGGESGLHVLFLCHLRTTSKKAIFFSILIELSIV